MTQVMQIDLLGFLVALNTIALFVVGVAIASFRRTIDRLDGVDKGVIERVGALEQKMARLEGAESHIVARIDEVLDILNRFAAHVEARFMSFDESIRNFYQKYDLPLKCQPRD